MRGKEVRDKRTGDKDMGDGVAGKEEGKGGGEERRSGRWDVEVVSGLR